VTTTATSPIGSASSGRSTATRSLDARDQL
jgi:hypothetical protein